MSHKSEYTMSAQELIQEVLRLRALEKQFTKERGELMQENKELQADLAARDALIGELHRMLTQVLGAAENADETGYVTDVGFVDLDALHAQAHALLARTRADAGAELERLRKMTSMTLGVGDGSGSLYVHGDYDSIKACQAKLLEADALRAQLIRTEEDLRSIAKDRDTYRAQLATAEARVRELEDGIRAVLQGRVTLAPPAIIHDLRCTYTDRTAERNEHRVQREKAEARLAAVLLAGDEMRGGLANGAFKPERDALVARWDAARSGGAEKANSAPL